MYGSPISASECNGFTIEYTTKEHTTFNPNFLFMLADSAADIIAMLKDNKDWEMDVCSVKKWRECGIVMYSGFDHFRFFESTDFKQIGPNDLKFKDNDRVRMKHTFQTSKCELFYNGKSIAFFEMKGNCIQPYLSQYYANIIQVSEYALF